MSMLLFVTHRLWSIFGDSGSVVSSVVSSAPALLSFHMLTGNLDRALMFGKVALARGAVQLPPGAAMGMAIGPQIVQPQPAAIVTMAVGTKMHRRIHRPGAAVRERHGTGPSRRRWRSLPDLLFTQRTVRLLRQALERFGLGGALALGLDGRGWRGGRGHASPGPAEM